MVPQIELFFLAMQSYNPLSCGATQINSMLYIFLKSSIVVVVCMIFWSPTLPFGRFVYWTMLIMLSVVAYMSIISRGHAFSGYDEDDIWISRTRYWAYWGPLIVIGVVLGMIMSCVGVQTLCNRYGSSDMYDRYPPAIVIATTRKALTYGTNGVVQTANWLKTHAVCRWLRLIRTDPDWYTLCCLQQSAIAGRPRPGLWFHGYSHPPNLRNRILSRRIRKRSVTFGNGTNWMHQRPPDIMTPSNV